MKQILFVSLTLLSCVVLGMKGPALPCNSAVCQLPDCRCSTTDIPGGFDRSEVPQVNFYKYFNSRCPKPTRSRTQTRCPT